MFSEEIFGSKGSSRFIRRGVGTVIKYQDVRDLERQLSYRPNSIHKNI